LPINLFFREIIVEYRMHDQQGDLVSYINVKEDVSLFELEKIIHDKSGKWIILEQRFPTGARTKIKDDEDLRRAIRAAISEHEKQKAEGKGKSVTPGPEVKLPKKEPEKITVVFYTSLNLANKPYSTPQNAAAARQTTKPMVSKKKKAQEKKGTKITSDQFVVLQSQMMEGFSVLKRDITRDFKKSSNQSHLIAQQANDIYDEIQQVKANDRDFIRNT